MSGRSERGRFTSLLVLTLVAAILALPGFSDSSLAEDDAAAFSDGADDLIIDKVESADEDQGGGEEAAAAPRSGLFDKLQIHGFLTQAYAKADFVTGGLFPSPSSLESSIGIPEDGTTNYRFLALQFRYEISPRDIMVVQLSSRTLGTSPVRTVENEVELDWAFYERRLTDNMSIKVGRVQIPIGIYNDIRDVGTILPFYRPPFGWYAEGSFTSETIDGVVLSNTFFPNSDWSLDADVYCCEWQEFETGPDAPDRAEPVRAKDAYGFQLWLNTPVTGLRFGFGANTKRLEGGSPAIRPAGFTTPESDHFFASIDGTFDRFAIRSEYRELESILFLPFVEDRITTISKYVQLGFFATERIHVWLQWDDVELRANSELHTRPEHLDFRTDYGISFNYRFRPDLVLKAEYHVTEEEQGTFRPIPAPGGGILLDPFSVETDDGNYWILSLSVSF